MADEIVEQLGVKTAGIDAPITSLSGGNQQKAIIGRWLLTEPKVLLLDDPTRGIDVGAKAEIYRLMDELCRAGPGHHRHLQRAARAAHGVRPHPRAVRRPPDRRVRRAEATEQRIMEAATMRRAASARNHKTTSRLRSTGPRAA